jgi:hypothetical protein
MEIDTSFPTKLDTVSDAPEPLRGALVESLPSGETVRLLVHAPAFSTGEEKSPATVLAVTNNGWLLASETEDGGAALEKSGFSDILFLELKSILLLGQLKIYFAAVNTSSFVTIKFEAVWDEVYLEAVELMLAGIDPASTAVAAKDRNEASIFEGWPMKFRNEAQRYWPKGQRLLAAIQWPPTFGELQRQIAPAGALLISERQLVLISDEKESPAEASSGEESKEKPPEQETQPDPGSPKEVTPTETLSGTPLVPITGEADIDAGKLPGDVYEFGEIIAFVPRVRLVNFQMSHRERFGVLALQVHAAQGGENLEVIFPRDHEKAVSKAMEQALLSQGSATQAKTKN